MKFLKPYINFNEVEDGVLVVDSNSECYYIEYNGNKYLAWKNVDSVTNEDIDANVIEYKNSYYSILDGELILKETILENKDGIISGRVAKVQLLKKLLGITGNKSYTFYKDDVIVFINFKEEKAANPKKTYF